MSPLDLHVLGTPPAFVLSQDQTLAFDSVLNLEVSFKLKTHLRIDCLFFDTTRENRVRVLLDSVSFSRIMCRAFRLRSRATAQLVYYLIRLLSIPFLNFFEHF